MQFDGASKALVELAASRHNAFSTSEAADCNFKLRRLQDAESRGELYRLYPKVWAVTTLPQSPGQQLRAATLAMPGAAASLTSAAWLHGWVEHPPPKPQLWVVPTSRARLEAAAAHRFKRIDAARDVTEVGHIAALNKAATICLLGAVSQVEVLERCVDEFLRTESQRWLEETMKRLYTPKTPGPHALRRLLEDPKRVAGIPESIMERTTAKLLALDELPPLVLQHQLEVEGRCFRLDIACPELKLGVEYHSRQHHWGPTKGDADNNRDLLLATLGWEVIYVTHSMIRDPAGLARRFRQTAQTRAPQLGVKLPASVRTGATT